MLKLELLGRRVTASGRYRSAPIFVKNPQLNQKRLRSLPNGAGPTDVSRSRAVVPVVDEPTCAVEPAVFTAEAAHELSKSVTAEMPKLENQKFHRGCITPRNSKPIQSRLSAVPPVYTAREGVGQPLNIQLNRQHQNKPSRLDPLNLKAHEPPKRNVNQITAITAGNNPL